MNPKQYAQLGLIYLEEAILDVLFKEAPSISAAEISKRIGIPALVDERHSSHYLIVTGILVKLQKEGRVERCEGKNWKLKDEEFGERNR